MSKQRINFRIQAVTEQQYLKELQHTLRTQTVKSTNNQINQNENVTIFNFDYEGIEDNFKKGDEMIYTNKDPDIKNLYKILKKKYNTTREEHKKVVKDKRDRYLGNDKKSYSMVVLTNFSNCSKNYNDKSVEEHFEAAKKTMEEFCKEFDTEYEYISIHLDEKGLPHCHSMVKNFNSKGFQLDIQTNKKNGEKCQDIMFDNFKHLGYDRGLSKDISKRKHLPTHLYKIEQDKLKEQQKEQDKLTSLVETNKDLDNIIETTSNSELDIPTILETLSGYKEKYKEEDKKIKRVIDYTYRTFNNLADMGKTIKNIERIQSSYDQLQPQQIKIFETILNSINFDMDSISKIQTIKY